MKKLLWIVLLVTAAWYAAAENSDSVLTGTYESIAFVEEGELISEYLTLDIRVVQGLYEFIFRVDDESLEPTYSPLVNPLSDDDRYWLWLEGDPWILEPYTLDDHLILYYAEEGARTPEVFIILERIY